MNIEDSQARLDELVAHLDERGGACDIGALRHRGFTSLDIAKAIRASKGHLEIESYSSTIVWVDEPA